ncbi:hypothetical protein [Nitrosovibrio sp. Nv4]|nr:hypothetical protein [Nitrosovibrio sp. Nv4]SOD41599.1 hypothetical protein SAMN06298226_1901 [Nitrosovibrio sp. Nv4]
MGEILSILNVLIIPVLAYVVRIEHRLTKLEGLSERVEKLEEAVYGGKA